MAVPNILDLALEDWVKSEERLLELEREAELQQAAKLLNTSKDSELEAQGISLFRLTVLDVNTGLFGRTLITCGDQMKRALPAHKFSSGDIVGVKLMGSGRSSAVKAAEGAPVRSSYDASGVVTSADDTTITLALDDESGPSTKGNSGSAPPSAAGGGAVGDNPELGDRVRLDRLADDVTFKRLRDVLGDLKDYRHGTASRLLRVLFNSESGNAGKFVHSSASSTDLPRFLDAVPPIGGSPAKPSGPTSASSLVADAPASSAPSPADPQSDIFSIYGYRPFRPGFNPSQHAAISASLRAMDVCMIHGPPGTGKTTTVVEYIRQEVARGRRVLACAPSNVAVDNLLERLAVRLPGSTPKLVRLGHPARVSKSALGYSLEAQVQSSEGTGIVADVRKELTGVQKQIRSSFNKAERRELRQEERKLRSEIRKREEQVVAQVIRSADVVLATNTGAATRVLRKALGLGSSNGASGGAAAGNAGAPESRAFDVVVIDEVAQSLEAACLIPAMLGSKLIVAGDHYQLPPTIVSEEAARQGLQSTLADRLVRRFGDGHKGGSDGDNHMVTTSLPVVHMLDVQYRMHEDIMQWSSNAFYSDLLKADASVARHTLSDLHGVLLPECGEIKVRASQLSKLRSSAAESAKESMESAKASDKAAAAAASASSAPSTTSKAGQPGAASSMPGASSSASSGRVAMMDPRTAQAVIAQGAGVSSHGAASSFADASEGGDVAIDCDAIRAPVLLIDSAGCDLEELVDATSESKSNIGEADVVVKHVLALLNAGVQQRDIAVITPYNAQVSLLRAMLSSQYPLLEVRSVDGFQGQEKEAVVMSLVRSNPERNVGFLADYRRLNVAVTRARRHVAIVADTDTVSSDKYVAGLVAYCNEHGEVRSAMEYQEIVAVKDASSIPMASSAAAVSTSAAATTTRASVPSAQKSASHKAAKTSSSSAEVDALSERNSRKKDAQVLLKGIRTQLKSFIKQADAIGIHDTGHVATADVTGTLSRIKAIQLVRDVAPFSAALLEAVEEAAGDGDGDGSGNGTAHGDEARPAVVSVRIVYPTALQPLHRALIHRAAGDLGLGHSSTSVAGDDGVRQIVVTYHGPERRAVERQRETATPFTRQPAAGTAIAAASALSTPLQVFDSDLASFALEADDNTLSGLMEDLDISGDSSSDADANDDDDQTGDGYNAISDAVDGLLGSSPSGGQQAAGAIDAGGKSKGPDKKKKTGGVATAAAPPPLPPAATASSLLSTALGTRLGSLTDAGSTTAPAPIIKSASLLATLHAERLQRQAKAASENISTGVDDDDDGDDSDAAAPSIVAGAASASSKSAKKRAKQKAKASSSSVSSVAAGSGGGNTLGYGSQATASRPPPSGIVNTGVGPDGIRREFGVPVIPLKPVAIDPKTGKVNANGSVGGSAAGASAAAAGADGAKIDSKTSSAKSKSKQSGGSAAAADDDDMALLDSLLQQSKVCGAKGCSKSTQATGTTCTHCHLRFCYSHGLPEVHGCGNAARSDARKGWLGGGGMAATTGVDASKTRDKVDESRRRMLHSQLQKKVDAAAADRTPKQKDNKDAKK